MEVASLSTFRVRPEKFYNWFRPLAKLILDAEPNIAHMSLAQFEAAGFLKATITQNIDGLHQRAGSTTVHEVHGTLNTLTCGSCYTQYPSSDYTKEYIEQGNLPQCQQCGGILKPDAILFEEQLPQDTWRSVQREMVKCDLMLVVGSSLEVVPVARLPYTAVSQGASLIIINNEPTYIDSRADVVFHQDVIDILPAIAEKLIND